MTLRAILLDFNGVIVDDERLQLRAYAEALAGRGVRLTEADYFSSLGLDDRAFVRKFLPNAGDGEIRDVIDRKTAAHREMIRERLPLFPGAVAFIESAARTHALAVVSMARREDIAHVLERAGLAGRFEVVVSAEDVAACKPDPACYRRAVERLRRFAAKECVALEDSPPGIQAARGAGVRAVGVTNTVSEAELRTAGAELVLPSLEGLDPEALALRLGFG